MDLQFRSCLIKAQDKKDPVSLRKAYNIIKDAASDSKCVLPELYVLCAEEALQMGCKEITEDCLMMYFESKPPTNQFLCRAYFCQAQLKSCITLEDMDKAVMYYLKSIEISKHNPRYHFLVFNASLLYYQSVRLFLQPGRCQHLVSSLSQVLKALQEVQEPDCAWRAELMLLYVECLVDAGKHKEAAAFAQVTSDFIELHNPELYPRIFSLQVRHDLTDVSKSPKIANPRLLVIYKLQKLKQMAEVNVNQAEISELREIFRLLTQTPQPQSPPPHSSGPDSSSIILTDRTELLLELAFLSLQFKDYRTVEDCITELKTINTTTVSQRFMMECVECQLVLKNQNSCIEDYSKSSVEVQLSVVTRLDALLQKVVRQGDAEVIQCVCAAQWNICLPLLQHNLRHSITTPLSSLANTLLSINSTLLDIRCELHAELAAIYEEEEKLESALNHLHTALSLDQTGQHQQRLQACLHRLQLQTSIYRLPTRPEDQAALLIQQAKKGSSCKPVKKCRSLLVSAGSALAADIFQMVLDADTVVKVPASRSQILVEQLSAKAQHHHTCVQKLEGHLARLEGGGDDRERVKLWASLVKAARKREVWDVCRAACRFCLLYDDGRWKNECELTQDVKPAENSSGVSSGLNQEEKRDLLRLLAEVHFISAEATIHKLRSEGVELNGSPVPPVGRKARIPENDPNWTLYSDWIRELSAYATASFLRGAELGAELQEAWLVANSAVYLWNYNNHMLVKQRHRTLLPTFSRLVELLRQTGHAGELVLLVLLCDAVAQGIIQPWCETAGLTILQQDSNKTGTQPSPDKIKKSLKGLEKPGSTLGAPLETSAVLDIKKALELCDFALRLTGGSRDGETVPIMIRKQIISTWVKTKRLLQQQITQKLNTDDECKSETVSVMSRVLVGVEMLVCNNNPGLMEFTVPSLGTLVKMACECRWSDPVVELYVWSQLAHFSYQSSDHDLLMTCTHNALQLEQTAVHKAKVTSCSLYSVRTVKEMLSRSACLRGLSSLFRSSGHPDTYTAALTLLQSSISYAEEAGSWSLCVTAAKHYWNACLPLLTSSEQRRQLQEPLQLILKALNNTYPQSGTERNEVVSGQNETTVTSKLDSDNGVAVRAAMYSTLYQICTDSSDMKRGLQLLDQAIRDLPRSPHRLLLYKQRVVLKAQLGDSIMLDIQRFTEEGELSCALMWRRAALCAKHTQQQHNYYHNTIKTLQSDDYQRQKVDYLLEFGEWLYCNNFPLMEAQLQIQEAINILISISHTSQRPETCGQSDVSSGVSQLGLQGLQGELAELVEVWCHDVLIRAHTLLALLESRLSPQYQNYLLLAYSSVLHIWQVSMQTAQEVIKEELKNTDVPAPPASAASVKKDKEKEKDKVKKPPTLEKKTRGPVPASLPSSLEQWVQFECPEEVRQVFRRDHSLYSINTESISLQSRTLFYLDALVRELESVSLSVMTLPLLHLAEVISADLSLNQSQSDLYRLRIVKTCGDLGLDSSSPYRDSLLTLARIPEDEQMECRKLIVLQRERKGDQSESHINKTDEPVCSAGINSSSWWSSGGCAVQELWLDKAAVCVSLSLYQPARLLLTETHLLAKELGDQTSLAKSFQLLAVLAGQEQQYGEALALLDRAQMFDGDAEFWYQITLTLLNTTAQLRGEDTYTQMCQITDRTTELLKSALDLNPNRAPVLHFYTASLQAKCAVLCRSALRSSSDRVETEERLKSVCETLKQSASVLLQYGYTTPAVHTTVEHANTLRTLAFLSSIKEERQCCLLQALSLMQKVVSQQEEELSGSLSLLQAHQDWRCRLPAVQVCVDSRLALVDLALLMLEMQCEEEKIQTRVFRKMSSSERAVQEYIHNTADLKPLQQEWVSVCQSLGQMALTQLSAVNSLNLDCVETKARALGMLGKCLRLIVLKRDPLYSAALWDGPLMMKSRAERKLKEDEDEEEERRGEEETHNNNSAEIQSSVKVMQQKLSEATNSLCEALSLCLQHNFPSLLAQVCVELLECYSQWDPATSGQYLALLQSCVCCAEMSSVLGSVCSDSGQSQLAALLVLQKNLQSQYRDTSLLSAIDHTLHTLSKASQYLTINPNHLSLLGEMPPNLKILLLQHSEDGSVLYGGFYEKTKAAESQKGKSVQTSGGLSCSMVVKAEVQSSVLKQLREQLQTFRQISAHTLLKESRQHKHTTQGKQHTHQDNSRALRSHLEVVVQGMEEYLHPVLSQFDFSCFSQRPPSISISETGRPKEEERGAADKAQSERGECVLVLADRVLMEMPLEALAVLQGEGISSVCRDFSLQVFHTRLQREQPVESENKKESRGGKPAKGKADQSKAIKVAPLNRVLPPHTLPVDTHNFKYIVDPHGDGGDCDGISPADRMRAALQMYSQQCTPLWEGLIGRGAAASPADLEHLLTNCSSFIFYGTERFLSHISPARLVTLNLTDCQMMILFDQVHTDSSFLRQSQQDVQKSETQLALEAPLECVYLLTLCGVHSVMLNQWTSSDNTNTHNMETLMQNLLIKGLTSGQSVHSLRMTAAQRKERDVNDQRDAECPVDVDAGPGWCSPSVLNFIIFGLPNLVVT